MKYFVILLFVFIIGEKILAQPCDPDPQCNSTRERTFKILKEGFVLDTTNLKINGVYLFTIPYDDSSTEKYYFLRFFENGRVLLSSKYCSYPDSSEFENISYGQKGYYIVNGTQIVIETYQPYLGYYYKYASVSSDGLIFTHYKQRRKKIKNEYLSMQLYSFVPINLATSANW